MRRFLLTFPLCCAASLTTGTAAADALTFNQCVQLSNDAERLRCYDRAARVEVVPKPVEMPLPITPIAAPVELESPASAPSPVTPSRSYLTQVWNLDDRSGPDESHLGRLHPHRQNYLIVRKSSNTNNLPSTPTPGHTVPTVLDMDALESKFLISLKADITDQHHIDFLGFKTVRLWGAYTQQSHWQVFNSRNSSPFRETNYEPELIASFGTGNDNGLKLVNIGINHQSNGKSLPLSRSWNRVYVQGGWEFNNSTSIMARGWWRIPENAANDDNPDILDYIGRADVVLRWEPTDKSQSVALLLRNNLRMTSNRGYAQFDWSVPFSLGDAARFHIQLGSGYGESMIDYNQKQTVLGMGFSFREW